MKSSNLKRNGRIAGLFLLPVLFMLLATKKPAIPPVVIGYVAGYSGLINTDWIAAEKLTHINYAFVNVKNNRAVLSLEKTDTVNFRKLNLLKKKNPALKILISIGGWSWSGNFSDAVLTDTARAAFAASAVDIIRKYNLDGVDIDWEYPGRSGASGNVYRKEDKQNYTLMFKDLRAQLDILEKETRQKKLLTTAVGGFSDFLKTTEMDKAQQYLDYINLMTYDFYSDKVAGHHTNLHPSKTVISHNSAENSIDAFIASGVPANKLVIGIAFYGRTYQLTANAQNGLGDSIITQKSGKDFTFLKDSLINKKGYKAYLDKAAKAPYLFNSITKEFITYDDEASVKSKCKYALDRKIAGVMFWEYSSDPKEYLLNEIVKAFK